MPWKWNSQAFRRSVIFIGFELYDFLVAGDVLIEGNYETDGLSAANHDLDKLFLALQIAKSV